MVSSTPSARAGMPKFAFPALILANLILPLGPVLVRMADVGPVAAAFWRLTLALPFLLILALPRLRRTMPTIREWSALIWSGLFFAADLAAWHIGILYTKVTNATIFGNMSGLMLPIWGMVVLRQRPRAMQAIALTLATAGAAVMMGGSYELSPRYLHGDLLCLLAGATYTGYLLIVQRARVRLDSWSVLAMSTLFSIPPLLLCALWLGERIMPGDWTPLVVLALSSQLVGQGLLTYAISWFTPLVLGLSLLLQPAVSAVLGWVLFGEWLSVTDMVGTMAIAAALVLVRLPSRA
ncbi:MAG: DMT family transporter [Sphingobium sp.]|mgnify:FL=1|jgi:drug/metabolite transporter (DMT)-like permease|uniref:DMT family transporter n=2 Tax=Sphingobium sp. TaxID=1912891 RepID=UPI000C356B69|nr:DMT family transporter [Sphingobium sp.]MBU0657397.1 DMT family transporter [Alphaproteobacteria bacterium]MBA4753257.1 DMT family transporter [Sphingobium sp.]MBS88645.1 EamA family transporter [Sphingobium sp.]MBU0773833.1 DMT family transporter [Alphaproteobacteria bacterium]MBU0868917.1 DMT family transporter [Alphaproteobacteria bacterium]